MTGQLPTRGNNRGSPLAGLPLLAPEGSLQHDLGLGRLSDPPDMS